MSVLAEHRKFRASRIAIGRRPLWWLNARRPAHPCAGPWIVNRLEDFRAWFVTVLICGIRGHRYGVEPGIPELGWEPAIACGRCGEGSWP